jgi:hypothetical protein
VHVDQIEYEASASRFFMPRPMGDDWLQQISHLSERTPKLVRIDERVMFVVYESAVDAEAFTQWLKRAEAEAQEGYRTMRG